MDSLALNRELGQCQNKKESMLMAVRYSSRQRSKSSSFKKRNVLSLQGGDQEDGNHLANERMRHSVITYENGTFYFRGFYFESLEIILFWRHVESAAVSSGV